MLTAKELRKRAQRELSTARTFADYLRIWRAKRALGYPTRTPATQAARLRAARA